MAEAALFSLASKLLGELSSQAFVKAYKRVRSIRGAEKDLDKLKEAIQTVQAVLLDAEKKQEDSFAVMDWIERARDVLYEADDLFDDVATNSLLRQQRKENKLVTKVRALFLRLNPIFSNENIDKKVKAIRERLDDISKDIARFNFMLSRCENETSGLWKREETRPFADAKVVIGRDIEKEVILEFLFDKSSNVEQSVSVIAIVGIGGMGKTTLAQLIYNDEEVQKSFETKWWACISDTVGATSVLERIAKSVNGQFHHGCDLKQLISESVISSGNYLLVLDDVWDNDLGIWFDIMSLLSSGVKGSKIIVTTRFSSVPRAMQKDKCQIYTLKGLPEDKSWELFRKIAFTEEQLNNPNWDSLGREIVKKCANVPLAIKSVASLLCTKDTMLEWESVKNEKLLSDGSIRSVLKLSYDHLQSDLKHCFAYCSLFPKDTMLYKQELIYLWIAHGYVKPKENETLEATGHAYYMELFRRSFFQEAEGDGYGEILCCKMHDLVHDLAQDVAGKESVLLTEGFSQFHKKIRHLSVAYEISDSWKALPPVLEVDRLRSCLFMLYSCSSLVFVEQVTKFRSLRALNLVGLSTKDIPSSIGELKYLRYLNLSKNQSCQVLPDSITKLVNLLTLDISSCWSLVALPKDFRKLISLRHLAMSNCDSLKHMPYGFGELTSLQHLSDFKVGKRGGYGGKDKSLNALAGLHLHGSLRICFDWDEDWSDEELILEQGHIPETIQMLSICDYPGMKIPVWWKEDPPLPPFKLISLELRGCREVKHLPPLECLRFLRDLTLIGFHRLEYIEDQEEVSNTTPFFPSLQSLNLMDLPKLEGWSGQQELVATHIAATNEEHFVGNAKLSYFPLLSHLKIMECLLLKSMPRSPHVQYLYLVEVREEIVHQLVSAPTSYSLQRIGILNCGNLTSFPGEGLTSLRVLRLHNCPSLKNVQLASNALEELTIRCCPNVELWDNGEEKRGVDWGSLANLRLLTLDKIPEATQLPDCITLRIALGKLQIQEL